MSPQSPREPFEILWTTEDTTGPGGNLKAAYDPIAGETWARPALIYHVDGEVIENEPDAFLVFGTGYVPATSGPADRGRHLVRADALTGAIVEQAELPAVSHPVYDSDYGSLVDTSVVSHCISRFWAEAQETYIADPAGRLFRWDLGRDTSHESDSGAEWAATGIASTIDSTTPYFPACTGPTTCSVTAGGNGDPFIFAPAVTANDRIDNATDAAAGFPPDGIDQALVALISGSTSEDTIDGFENGTDFHSSIYLLVDDHSTGDKREGFTIPSGAPKSVSASVGAGTDVSGDATSNYFRIALSDISRTRVYTPYPGAAEETEVRNFSRQTRPLRAPRIVVTGVADDSGGEPVIFDDLEVYFVEFTVYEPPDEICAPEFEDTTNNVWYQDFGSTYTVRFRLTADSTGGFNFQTGTSDGGVDFGTGFNRGLQLDAVEQINNATGDGNTGPVASMQGASPCRNEGGTDVGPSGTSSFSVPVRTNVVSGFSPIE